MVVVEVLIYFCKVSDTTYDIARRGGAGQQPAAGRARDVSSVCRSEIDAVVDYTYEQAQLCSVLWFDKQPEDRWSMSEITDVKAVNASVLQQLKCNETGGFNFDNYTRYCIFDVKSSFPRLILKERRKKMGISPARWICL